MMRHGLLAGTLVLTVGLMATARPGLAAQDLTDPGNGFIHAVRPDVPPAQRVTRVRELFGEDFDIPEMGRFVLGRYWPEMTPAQQQEFLGLFKAYTVRVYSARLNQFGGALFGVTGTRRNGDEIVVTSKAVGTDDDPPVEIDWHLIDRDGRYKITDVSVDGASIKAAQRDAFASVIEQHGGRPDTVLALLRQELAAAR